MKKPKHKKQSAPYIPCDLKLQLMIQHQKGLTNAEIGEKLNLSEMTVDEMLRVIGKTPNVKIKPEPSEYKVHIHIPQGKVVRADKPPEKSECDIELSKLPY